MSTPTTGPRPPTTRISFARLGIVLLGTTLVAGVGVRTISAAVTQPSDPGVTVFAPYVDVTVTPMYPFETPAGPAESNVTLAFVVSGEGAACSPLWGGAYTLDAAASDLQLDRRLSQLRLTGGSAAVSFGGQAGTELATSCTDLAELTAAYRSVVERYELSTIDLDLEGATLSDTAALDRRAQAVRDLQQERADSGDALDVWLTLPVGPSGLTSRGAGCGDGHAQCWRRPGGGEWDDDGLRRRELPCRPRVRSRCSGCRGAEVPGAFGVRCRGPEPR